MIFYFFIASYWSNVNAQLWLNNEGCLFCFVLHDGNYQWLFLLISKCKLGGGGREIWRWNKELQTGACKLPLLVYCTIYYIIRCWFKCIRLFEFIFTIVWEAPKGASIRKYFYVNGLFSSFWMMDNVANPNLKYWRSRWH